MTRRSSPRRSTRLGVTHWSTRLLATELAIGDRRRNPAPTPSAKRFQMRVV